MQHVGSVQQVWRQTLRIAVVFWAVCLALVACEATLGSSGLLGFLFFVSIPVLVGYLTWANKDIVNRIPRGLLSVAMLGISVLISSSVIIFVGLLAAANLKTLIAGA